MAEPEARMVVRLNWLRAGVLGANDGVVSIASLLLGVAGADASRRAMLTAGLAGLFAGALAMAVGEYVSVSSQRDSERALLAAERRALARFPQAELDELATLYQDKGLNAKLAAQVARELTAHDAFAAHAEAELGIDPDALTNPWHAAIASFAAFTGGAVFPLTAILVPGSAGVAITVVVVLACLVATGAIGAKLGRAPLGRAVARNVLGGALAMSITYGVGSLVGTTGL